MPIPTTARDPYEAHSVNMAEVQSENVLQARPNEIFFMGHHSDNWEIGKVEVEGKDGKARLQAYWLPEVMQIPVKVGCNGCRTLKEGEPKENAYAGMLKWLAEEKVHVILPDARVGDTGSYIAYTDCQHPKTGKTGRYHHDAWSRPKQTKKGKAVKLRRDNLAANAWRLELVKYGWTRPDGTTGRLPPMDVDVKADAIDRAEFHLSRKEAETQLPDRAYKHEVAAREDLVKLHKGAIVPEFIGTASTQVVDYSTAIRDLLVSQVIAGRDPDEAIATIPGLAADIAAAVHAAAPKRKPITEAPPKGKAKAGK